MQVSEQAGAATGVVRPAEVFGATDASAAAVAVIEGMVAAASPASPEDRSAARLGP